MSEIEKFASREMEKFHAAQARRRPDRNVCCKCAYDLAGVAEPPPTPAPPELKCPECGKPVSLRDHWRTDGWYSMKRLLMAAWIICIVPLAIAILTVVLRPAEGSDTKTLEWYGGLLSAAWVLAQISVFTLAVVIALLGTNGVALRSHLLPRTMALVTPLAIVALLIQCLRWLAH